MPTMLLATTVMATIPMPTMDTDMPITIMARGPLMLRLMPTTDMDMLPMPMDMPTMATTDIPMPTTMARGPLMPMLMPTTDMDMLPMPTDMPTTATTDIPMPTTDTIINLLNIC